MVQVTFTRTSDWKDYIKILLFQMYLNCKWTVATNIELRHRMTRIRPLIRFRYTEPCYESVYED